MQRPAHGPVTGQAPDWIEQPERSNLLALRAMAWVAKVLGRGAARLLLYPICLYFLAFAPRARSASRHYLGRALGRRARLADVFRHFHSFAAVILDRVFLLDGQMSRFDVRTRGVEIVEQILADGQGCVLLGAHLGSFEVTRADARVRLEKINILMYEENARNVAAISRAINPGLQVEVIALGQIDAMLKVDAALARGEAVGMLADRTLDDADTVRAPFLGAPARFPTGPIRIALMLKRPMALVVGLYLGGNRYDIQIERLAAPAPGLGRAAAVDDLVRRYAERLEHHCRLAPYNWFNFYDFWR